MDFNSLMHQIGKALVDNLPQEIGVAIATLILAGSGWVGSKLLRKKRDPPEIRSGGSTLLRETISTQYIKDVVRRGSTLSFGDPASWAVSSNDSEGLVTLDDIWTPLRVADSQTRKGKVGTHENMAEADEGTDLNELFRSTNEALLILGDPGSGKSTSLAMFTAESARNWLKDRSSFLPIWVNLGTVTSGKRSDGVRLLLSGVPEVGIAVTRSGVEGGDELNKYLTSMIVEGKALLLLDGLDEVKEHALTEVRSAISQVLGLRNGTRVVATCRKFDYRQSIPNRKIAIERELELLPYTPEEQKVYVERWYAAAVRIGRFTDTQAEELGWALIQELRAEELAELGKSPLLLALLTLIHSEEAKLPDTRAVVCDRAITYMLADSAKWRIREAGSSTIASPPVLSLAIELAYRNHLAEEKTAGDTISGVTVGLVNECASQICDVMARADTTKNAPSSNDLAGRLLKSHGLLLDSGNSRFKFSHRSFQEFLAGQYYAAGAHDAEAISRGSSIHWREPFKLMASFAGHEGENLFYILALIESLLAVKGASSVASIQLGAEMLTEIGRRRLALRQFDKVLEENGLWERARAQISEQVEDAALSLAERERSASVLGLLGDPRFISDGESLGPWSNLINVSAGPGNIGSSRLSESLLSTSGGFLGGVRRMEFGPLSIGRYPVTNAEFRAFIEGDGYTNQEYWQGELARGWVSGDARVLELIRQHWLSTLYEHHAKEIRDGEIDTGASEEESSRRTSPRLEPYYWSDRRFNQPNQPVVGINWWEASAFCAWATRMGHETDKLDLDHVICLPSEFEWEYASRPSDDDRIYPWGDEWSEEKAHVSTNTLNMRQPAPVGIYLEPWPGGPCDLAGNIWEWTASLHLPYSEEHDSRRLADDSLEERVVRGSSWYNSSIVAACSARAVDRSYNLFYDVGFRVVSLRRDLERAGSMTPESLTV